jgi:hypothetical protein
MSYDFSGKVREAYYTDAELSTVAVIYVDNGQNIQFDVTVDSADPRWIALLEEVTIEEIDIYTRTFHERHRDMFREAFEDYASRNTIGNVANDANIAVDFYKLVTQLLNFNNDDSAKAEDLFKVKLAIFDHELVKASDNKDVKTAIRRSSSPLEALMEFSKLTK